MMRNLIKKWKKNIKNS